tara:strand:+ start:2470 stop:3141 length:672 start_codon:yes stop_codon:yes gene_type:complete
MDVLVINDHSWDNFALVSKRLNPRCIDPSHKINYFYGKCMQYISNICNQNMMQLHRRPIFGENLKESFEDSLQFTKFCIIFHNFIEYNTLSSLFIELCKSNKIPYFIFSEHCEKFYFNGEYNSFDKFKNVVRQLEFNERTLVVDVPSYIIFSRVKSCPKNILDIVNNIRNKYNKLKEEKEARSIIYDEKIVKEKKKLIKSDKEMNYIDFMKNKIKWKESISKR